MIGKRSKDEEVDKIKSRLRQGEEILLITTQARAVKPATYFVTNERILIRDPGIVGDMITSIQWTDVGDFQMNRGAMRSSLEFVKSANGQTMTIPHIRKNDAEKMYELIEGYISNIRQRSRSDSTAQNPLDVLKMRLVNGEITRKKFEEMKGALE